MELFDVYKRYPFPIPGRVKFFNVFRYFFRFKFIERFIASKISKGHRFYKRFIPPVYFYQRESSRLTTVNGIKFNLDLSNLIEHQLFFHTHHEPGLGRLLSFVKSDSVVLDIGANVGLFTLQFAQKCTEGKVFAFEPSQLNADRLTRNIELNQLNNIEVLRLGVGEQVGAKLLYAIWPGNSGANRVLHDAAYKNMAKEAIRITTLDDFVESRRLQKVDIIKIDVEGYELFVLQGGVNVIKQFRPILFIELAEVNLRNHNIKPGDIVSLLRKLNYDLIDTTTMTNVDLAVSNIHIDILCLPKLIID
jgi:FkbM family methyltransferase